MVVNTHWLDSFPISYANFKAAGISDHSPAIVFIANAKHRKGRQFKFFNFLSALDGFHSTVHSSWVYQIAGNAQFQLCHKLRYLKNDLKRLSKNIIGKEKLNLARLGLSFYYVNKRETLILLMWA